VQRIAEYPRVQVSADGTGVVSHVGPGCWPMLAAAVRLPRAFDEATGWTQEALFGARARSGAERSRGCWPTEVRPSQIWRCCVNSPACSGRSPRRRPAWRVLDGVEAAGLDGLKRARARERAWLLRAEAGRPGLSARVDRVDPHRFGQHRDRVFNLAGEGEPDRERHLQTLLVAQTTEVVQPFLGAPASSLRTRIGWPCRPVDQTGLPVASVAELTGLLPGLTAAGWPEGMRVLVRRERPHPGTQISLFEAHDAADLITWTQTILLHSVLTQAEPKKLRYRLLHTAARIVRGRRTVRIRIDITWTWAGELAAAFHPARRVPPTHHHLTSRPAANHPLPEDPGETGHQGGRSAGPPSGRSTPDQTHH
jgi:hypothetical protein